MDNEQSPPVDVMGPWTIKAFPTEARRRIVRAAEIQGVTVGQWIERRLEEFDQYSGNVVVNHVDPGRQVPPAGLLERAQAVRVLADVVGMLQENSAPRAVQNDARRALRENLRALRPPELILEAPRHIRRQPTEIAGGDEPEQSLQSAGMVEAKYG